MLMGRVAPRIPRALIQWKRKPNTRLRRSHLDWIKTLPCVRCGRSPCDPAHVRIGTDGGTGLKPSDRYAVPLCRACHDIQHKGEVTFWAELGADPVDISNRLWTVTGNTEQALRTIARARQMIELKRREAAARRQ